MGQDRKKPSFWRRNKPEPEYDISVLRPAKLPKGERFETLADAREESERSEQLLRSFSRGSKEVADFCKNAGRATTNATSRSAQCVLGNFGGGSSANY
jgi:hypothetical protein